LTRRSDDQPVCFSSRTHFINILYTVADSPLQETFAKRLKAYAEATEPLLEHYEKAGVLWTVRGKTSDEITPQLDAEIQRRFA
jgi:adenylate kinase family enzyme